MVVFAEYMNENGYKEHIVGGKVISVQRDTDSTTVVIQGNEWRDGESVDRSITITFKNFKNFKIADSAAKINEGGFLAVRGKLENDSMQGSEFSFGKKRWVVPYTKQDGTIGENTVFFGLCCNPKETEKSFSVSMPIAEYDTESRTSETVWHRVVFCNNDNNKNLKENAKKILSPSDDGKKKLAMIIASGDNVQYDDDGNDYHSAFAFRFEAMM